MITRDYKDYIQDILDNMKAAESFLEGLSFEEFEKDKKTVYAVERCLEVIGEAAKHIPASLRKKHSGVPWKQMAGMRDKAIHEYFGVDMQVVWKTVKEEIVHIAPLIKEILEALGNENNLKR